METTTKLVEISLPFEGFYESGAGEEVGRSLFFSWCQDNGKEWEEEDELYRSATPEEVESYEEFRGVHYREYAREYAEAYAHGLARELRRELKMPVEFSSVEVDSPRFYNFTTDRIFAKVPEDVLRALYAHTDKTKLAEAVREQYTSGPGFSSFYSGDFENGEEWRNAPDGFDHNQWCTVLDVWMTANDVERYELAY